MYGEETEGEGGLSTYRSLDPLQDDADDADAPAAAAYLQAPGLAPYQPPARYLPIPHPDLTQPAHAYAGEGGGGGGGLPYVVPGAPAPHPTGVFVNRGVGLQEPYLHLLLPPGAQLPPQYQGQQLAPGYQEQQGYSHFQQQQYQGQAHAQYQQSLPRGLRPNLRPPRERSLDPLPSHRRPPRRGAAQAKTGLDRAWVEDYRSPNDDDEDEDDEEGEDGGGSEGGSELSGEQGDGDRPASLGMGLAAEEEERKRVLGGLDLDNVLGQQLTLWSHRQPDTLAVFTPIPGDSLLTAAKFARATLKTERGMDKVLVLLPGEERPTEPREVFRVKAGTAILLLPRFHIGVTLEIRQLNLKFKMHVQVTMTVGRLKQRLQGERGLPADRLELLYRDAPMENHRFLLDYHVKDGRTIFAMLQVAYDIRVKVETFWGMTYHLHVDPCMTGLNVIWCLLRRTVSRGAGDVAALFELYLPKHTLVLSLQGQVVSWGACLGLYGVCEGDTLSLSTVGLGHAMELQSVSVSTRGGKVHVLKASRLDRWSTVALMMHGITDIPVNLIRLKMADVPLDFSATIGKFRPRVPVVNMEVATGQLNSDLLYGVPISFQLGNGITEVIKVSPKRTFRWVLRLLEAMGVANASLHEVTLHGYHVPGSARVVDVVDDYRQPVQLKLRKFPIFIHAPNKTIYKMTVYTQETVAAVKLRIQNKTGLSMASHRLLCAGRELQDQPEDVFFETQVAMKASLFLVPRTPGEIFLVLVDDWLVKVRLPPDPRASSIKKTLWRETEIPSGSLASIGNFFLWYFGSRAGPGLPGQPGVPGRGRKQRRYQNVQGMLPLRASIPAEQLHGKPRNRRAQGGGEEKSQHWRQPGDDPMYDLLIAGSTTELGLDRKALSMPDHHHLLQPLAPNPRGHHPRMRGQPQSAYVAGWGHPQGWGERARPSWHYSLQRLHREAHAQPAALHPDLAPAPPRRRHRKRRKRPAP